MEPHVYWGYPVQIKIPGWSPPENEQWEQSWIDIMYALYPGGHWQFIRDTPVRFEGVFIKRPKNDRLHINDDCQQKLETFPRLGSNPEWLYHTLRWVVKVPFHIELPLHKSWVNTGYYKIENEDTHAEWDTWGQHVPSLEEQMGKQLTLEEITDIEEDEDLKNLPYEQSIEDVAQELPEYSESGDRACLVSIFGGGPFQFSDE